MLVGRDPGKFEPKYADAPDRAAARRAARGAHGDPRALIETATLSGIELVLGREEAVVGRVQDLTLQVGNDFVQRYYSNLLELTGEQRPPLRRGAERRTTSRR